MRQPKTTEIPEAIRDVLAQMVVSGQIVLPYTRQLDRKTYEQLDKVLQAAGGKWKRGKGHVFPDGIDVQGWLAAATRTGSYIDPKANNVIQTPDDLARDLVEQAGVQHGHRVLEPSAGPGNLANAAREAGGVVTCVELLPLNCKALRERGFDRVIEADFLAMTLDKLGGQPFDRAVMNPPFSANEAQEDIAHVLHAFSFLTPGGLLVAVMAAGVVFRDNKKTRAFRAMVEAHSGHISPLPDFSFSVSGTDVRTVVVTMLRGGDA